MRTPDDWTESEWAEWHRENQRSRWPDTQVSRREAAQIIMTRSEYIKLIQRELRAARADRNSKLEMELSAELASACR